MYGGNDANDLFSVRILRCEAYPLGSKVECKKMTIKTCECTKCAKKKRPLDVREVESRSATLEEHYEGPALEPRPDSRFVILKGLNNDNIADRIFQPYPLPGTNEKDPTKNKAGEKIYEIVGFASTILEAQAIFLGIAHRARGPFQPE